MALCSVMEVMYMAKADYITEIKDIDTWGLQIAYW